MKEYVSSLSKEYECRIRCRTLYKRHLLGEKWKNVESVDEAWVCLSGWNKERSIFYYKSCEKILLNDSKNQKKVSLKGFMTVVGFSHKGRKKVKKLTKMPKSTLNTIKKMF